MNENSWASEILAEPSRAAEYNHLAIEFLTKLNSAGVYTISSEIRLKAQDKRLLPHLFSNEAYTCKIKASLYLCV